MGSCLMVCRPNSSAEFRTVFKTEPGRYDRHRPVQIQRLHGFSSSHAHSVIRGATVSSTPVQPGDVLVLGSDGLFDNLEDCAIESLLNHHRSTLSTGRPSRGTSSCLRTISSALVDLAISELDSQTGNPPDDTTALVAVVTTASLAAASERCERSALVDCSNLHTYRHSADNGFAHKTRGHPEAVKARLGPRVP